MHHLFQKYLYGELDPVERAGLHGGVAAALARQVGDGLAGRERFGARLAWHYEAGGLPLQAARALLDAGHQAMRLSAFLEALGRYGHGLALFAGEPPCEERGEIERLLEVARLAPLRNLEGIACDRLQGALSQAAAAWAGAPAGGAPGRPKLMLLAAEVERLFAMGQFEHALATAEQMRAQATEAADEELAGQARFYAGLIHHCMGDLQQSEQHLDWVLDWLSPKRRANVRATLGMDLLANALAFSALNRWFLGYPEQALARSRQAVAESRAEGAIVGQAASTAVGASLRYFLRIDERTLAEGIDESTS
jgi:tetratricopeptide (TPR) repeat protein